jgi:hypothetical protein
MYVAVVPNRTSPPAILLRESYRENGKVKNRTLANLSDWEPERIEALRRALKGELQAGDPIEIVRALPHGHVAAILGLLRDLGLDRLIGSRRSRERDLVVAMVVQRLLDPRSKMATAAALRASTRQNSLGDVLELGDVTPEDLYDALDWLVARQAKIEAALAKQRLRNGVLVLYDLTSVWMTGRKCELARRGYSRDGRRGTLQIVFGLLTDADGCPVAVEVFEGDSADPSTLATQIGKVRERFGLERVVLVGDRGMITDARIREDIRPIEGLDWISALRASDIQELHRDGAFQLSLFEQTDLAEVSHPDYPGERLVVCRNPLLMAERRRKRGELLAATERDLEKVRQATLRPRNPLSGAAEIGLRVGQVVSRYKMRKHFVLTIADDGFSFRRREDTIAREAVLDGLYVIRTSVSADRLDASEVVRSYKRLAGVERAFRSMKTTDLAVRPVYHRAEDRVRAHVLLCMLAYYVEWHARRRLAPLTYQDEDPAAGEAQRSSVVAKAQRSPGAHTKASVRVGADGLPIQSFATLLADLATLTKNRARHGGHGSAEFDLYASPTPTQARAFELLGVPIRA